MTLFDVARSAAFVLHIAGGAIGLVSGIVAVTVRKGGKLHRQAGQVFVAAMIVMGIFAAYLSLVIDGQRINLLITVFALYFVVSGWLAARRARAGASIYEKGVMLIGIALSLPFVVLSVQLAIGFKPFLESATPLEGPVLIAIYSFTLVLVLASLGDISTVVSTSTSRVSRISRHLWRMCLGLTLALGSGFTNGFARLLPGPYHVPLAFFLPQFVPLVLLGFWLVRVRMKSWRIG